MRPEVRRLLHAVLLLAAIILVGGAVIWHLGGGAWSLADGLYMAVISAATVGFSELPEFDKVPGARLVAVFTILFGIGAITYFQSALTAFFVESTIGEALRRKRMHRTILELSDHVVVAGVGSTGVHVLEELVATRTPFVVIDRNREHLDRVSTELLGGKMLYVLGDATEDHTLVQAGIERASGLIAALTHDRDNLYVTLSARSLNAKARIVSKVVEPEAAAKMLRAGANATVSPNTIGGRRMASELIRPTVVEFLDQMLRDKERNLRFAEVTFPPDSKYIGRALKELPTHHETNTLVVAMRPPGGQLQYNPPPEVKVEAGTIVVVLGQADDVVKLRDLVGDRSPVARAG